MVPVGETYFKHETDVGIIGTGETIENCFADAARLMFALMIDVPHVHLMQIITFDFEEDDVEKALVTWLNLILLKAEQHQLMFGDFRLMREGKKWKATVSGEPWRKQIERGVKVKSATSTLLSVKKIDHLWEARCVVVI